MFQRRPGRTVLFATRRPPEPTVLRDLESPELALQCAVTLRELSKMLDEKRPPLAIVTDLILPDGNWRDLVERVREAGVLAPIMLLSPRLSAELWWDALECGVAEVVCGPEAAIALCRILAADDEPAV